MKIILITFSLILVLLVIAVNGCRFISEKPEKEKVSLVKISGKNLPVFTDDLQGSGLKEAIGFQIEKLKRGDLDQPVKLGEMVITRQRILKTLECFYG